MDRPLWRCCSIRFFHSSFLSSDVGLGINAFLDFKESHSAVGNQIKKDGFISRLLILDNLSTLAPGMQENEADAWAPIQTWILKLRTKGVSVLLIHHAGRSGRPRGTSRREDALDTVIKLKHSDSYTFSEGACFEVHIEKARSFFGDDAEPFIANLGSDENGALCWKIQAVQDDLYDEVVEGVFQKKSYRELAKELEVSKAKVEGLVKKAREKGDLPEVKEKK